MKLREKEQELKLVELKIKELKKQIPYSKLKPIRLRTNRTIVSNDAHSIDNISVKERENEPYKENLLSRKRTSLPKMMAAGYDLRNRKNTHDPQTKKTLVPSSRIETSLTKKLNA